MMRRASTRSVTGEDGVDLTSMTVLTCTLMREGALILTEGGDPLANVILPCDSSSGLAFDVLLEMDFRIERRSVPREPREGGLSEEFWNFGDALPVLGKAGGDLRAPMLVLLSARFVTGRSI